jgi:CRISPR/Cas system-associated exonuclease Cas4 (RecB family)
MTEGTYTLSNSEIQTYKDCRRKWWLAYYRRLKPKQKKYSGPLALGSRVHEALDQYYSTDSPLLDIYASLVQEERKLVEAQTEFTSDFETEADLGRIMLEGYLDWVEEEGIDAELEFISTEEILTMPMFDGSVQLQGKLDMRVRRKA